MIHGMLIKEKVQKLIDKTNSSLWLVALIKNEICFEMAPLGRTETNR